MQKKGRLLNINKDICRKEKKTYPETRNMKIRRKIKRIS